MALGSALVLKDCGPDLGKLVRLNVYALAPTTVIRSMSKLMKTLG